MIDMSALIKPKSDQLNADDLIVGPLTIKITKVTLSGSPDQPVCLYFEGDGGKPYKPGLSMRRVLVALWGVDGNQYVGRRMRLYRDPKVRFGGLDVGGIRISHLSHIKGKTTMALTETKAKRAPFTVEVLGEEDAVPAKVTQGAEALILRIAAAAGDAAALDAIEADKTTITQREFLATKYPDWSRKVDIELARARAPGAGTSQPAEDDVTWLVEQIESCETAEALDKLLAGEEATARMGRLGEDGHKMVQTAIAAAKHGLG